MQDNRAPHDRRPRASPQRSRSWTAIVLAGHRPGGDPLAAEFGVTSKALADIAGEPMLSYVVRALKESGEIGRILILGQDIDDVLMHPKLAWIGRDADVTAVRSGDGISLSIRDAIKEYVGYWPVCVTTADNVLLTNRIVSHFLREAEHCDVAAGLVERSVLAGAYPEGQRTWLKFSGGAYTGANLFAFNSAESLNVLDFWSVVESRRKSLYRIAIQFGPWLLLRIFLRRLTLRDSLLRAGLRVGVSARAVILPFAEAGIDVDKRTDHELAERILLRRARLGNPASAGPLASARP